MSGEVVASNPYSRLMALQRMGIVKDYDSKTVRLPTTLLQRTAGFLQASVAVNAWPRGQRNRPPVVIVVALWQQSHAACALRPDITTWALRHAQFGLCSKHTPTGRRQWTI